MTDSRPRQSPDLVEEPVSAADVVAYNARRLGETREQWMAANWKALSQIDREALEAHPDRSRLAIIGAASALQTGDRATALEQMRCSMQWGGDKPFMLSVLLASARHSLGRACLAAGRVDQAAQHLQHSLFDPHLQSEGRRMAQERTREAFADLAASRDFVGRQRKSGLKPPQQTPPAWIEAQVKRCLSRDDLHDAVDNVLDSLLTQADERVWFLMSLAEHFDRTGDQHTAAGYLNSAVEFAHDAAADLRLALARRLVAYGHAAVAMDMLVDETVKDIHQRAGADESAFAQALAHAYKTARDAEQSRREHGHELLLAHLKRNVGRLKAQADGRRLNMVEIGTTRENVQGQGSTRKLADFCTQEGIAFVTVDMDPHNTHVAQRMFERLSMDFEAVAMKGEDYLRERKETVDFAFLDAYDFDHGKHSELRQSRYMKYLGSRIDEEACHQMHLECAESLLRLLSPLGLICVDDTWMDKGRWTAKGTLAVPFLLKHGFEIVDARNRAALLRRMPGSQAV
ncbi:MAG: hypothetical protein IV094_06535 [Vitreoscilla sp.]|nr:hypothetical protein [Vitreoscilla sp.]